MACSISATSWCVLLDGDGLDLFPEDHGFGRLIFFELLAAAV
jgi:hypothetical protein